MKPVKGNPGRLRNFVHFKRVELNGANTCGMFMNGRCLLELFEVDLIFDALTNGHMQKSLTCYRSIALRKVFLTIVFLTIPTRSILASYNKHVLLLQINLVSFLTFSDNDMCLNENFC